MYETTVSYRILQGLMRLFDVAAMMLCFVLAALILSPDIDLVAIPDFLAIRFRAANVVLFVFISLIWAALMAAFDLYSDLSASRLNRNLTAFLKADVLGSAVLFLLGLTFGVKFVDGRFLLIFCGSTLLLGATVRVLVAYALSRKRTWAKNRTDYLLVGMNPRAVQFARSLEAVPESSHNLLGYVDVGPGGHPVREAGGNINRLTSLDELPDFLRHNKVDEVVLCLPLKSYYDEASQVISLCEEQGITIRVLADFFQTRMTHSRVEEMASHSVITVASHNVRGARAIVKRVIDTVVALAVLIILAPVLLLAAISVAFSSPGPIFFSQERVGLNKKIFSMLKFRTMVADAELRQGALESMNEAAGPAFKIRNDPRITPIGRFLRKFSIDELPQLINVIKGDMSLVGPRPLPLRDYAGFQEDWHRRRLSVRPGITGLWQVKDRDHNSFETWMKLDIQYIDQWSLLLDLKILLQTIPAVLRGSGE